MSDGEENEEGAVSVQPVSSNLQAQEEVACYELSMTRKAKPVKCPNCQKHVVSVTRYQASKCQWCCCTLICLMGGTLFGLIPCCCNKYSHVQHRCPVCNYIIAVAKYQDTTQK